MTKLLSILLLFAIATTSIFSLAESVTSKEIESFEPKTAEVAAQRCSYTVIIKTSCSSTPHTRDIISLAFGDVHGNKVHVSKLGDPSSRAFEKCSSDTFVVNGPCTHDICHQHLLRSGPDGWKPESVKIFGQNIRSVTFFYNTFLPDGVWFGVDECHRHHGSDSASTVPTR